MSLFSQNPNMIGLKSRQLLSFTIIRVMEGATWSTQLYFLHSYNQDGTISARKYSVDEDDLNLYCFDMWCPAFEPVNEVRQRIDAEMRDWEEEATEGFLESIGHPCPSSLHCTQCPDQPEDGCCEDNDDDWEPPVAYVVYNDRDKVVAVYCSKEYSEAHALDISGYVSGFAGDELKIVGDCTYSRADNIKGEAPVFFPSGFCWQEVN